MASDPKTAFPRALQYYMSINGKKQQDLIKDLNISSATLSQWVNGKMFPRMDKVEMLATYFRITTTDLLTDPYDKPKTSSDPLMIAKLLESSPPLYELFRLTLNLQEDDIILLKGVAERLLQLQRKEE
jgi:transcriptional regulator with XRE-family HTH domain